MFATCIKTKILSGTTTDEVYNLLNSNFEKHYLGNRAPFGLYLHAAWLLDTNHLNGYKKYSILKICPCVKNKQNLPLISRFLDGLTVKDDVFIVSVSQLLEWVKSPTPLSSIENFVPWQCDTVPSIPCAERRCAYDAAHSM